MSVLEEQLQVVCHKPIQPEQIRLSNFADVIDAKLQIVKTISLIMWVLLGVNFLGLITALFLRSRYGSWFQCECPADRMDSPATSLRFWTWLQSGRRRPERLP